MWPDQPKELTVLISAEDERICLLSLNEKLFLVTAADVRSIPPATIKTIQYYFEEHDLFAKFTSDYISKYPNIVAVIVIESQKGATFPEKFQKSANKQK